MNVYLKFVGINYLLLIVKI